MCERKIPTPSFVPGQAEKSENETIRMKARLDGQRDVRMYTLLREFGLQLASVLLILVICYANRDVMTYNQNEAIKDGIPTTSVSHTEKIKL